MSNKLALFKKNIIDKSVSSYNNNVNIIKQYYNNLILRVSKQKGYKLSQKNNIIKSLISEMNSKINVLKKELSKYVGIIQKLQYTEVSKNNNNKNALIIGINYENTANELYGCINDANCMNEYFMKIGFSNNVVITDRTTEKPTRTNIIGNLTSLLKNANEGDNIVFTYSGHGSYVKDTNNDEITGYDQVILPIDLQAIIDDELKIITNLYLKKNVTLLCIFDSCFSQSILDTRYQYLDTMNHDDFTVNDKAPETTGNIIVISGCTDVQTSADATIGGVNRGVLTWAFSETMKENNNISWRELITKMRTMASQNNFPQVPQISSNKFMDIDDKIWLHL